MNTTIPKKLSNEKVYVLSKQDGRQIIRMRSLNGLDILLDYRIAFAHHMKDIKEPRARSQENRVSMIKKDLQNIGLTLRNRFWIDGKQDNR